MRKVIGIVGEGPIDQLTLKTVIDTITEEKNIYRFIQPEQDVSGQFGNGWKGVYRWCETNAELIPALFTDIVPCLDLLIIQMDGDVARKEKEVHCLCTSTDAWIVAAYDDIDEIESIADPWEHIISLKKEYHGIRIPGHKKSTVLFKQFMPVLTAKWKQVVQKCESAALFEAEVVNATSTKLSL